MTALAAPTFFDLPQRGVLEITGEDRVRWLNGMISNDVATLGGEDNGCRAVLLSRRGRVIADLNVLAFPDRIWLELEASFVGPVIEQLDRYVIADDVNLADLCEGQRRFALEGDGAKACVEASWGALPTSPYAGAALSFGGGDCVVACYGFGASDALQFFVAEAQVEAFREAMASLSPTPQTGSAERFEELRVLAGSPRLGAELDETVLPDEAGLEEAISTTKGCYTGQEVIARLRSRGRIKHRLVGLSFAGAVRAGDSLTKADKAVGEVTSALESESHGWVGLGFVKVEESEAGTALSANGAEAKVVSLPFPGSQAA